MNQASSQADPTFDPQLDPQLDLAFERMVDIPPALVWAAWTTPRHIEHWFTPAPWRTVGCTIDLRPGGLFHTVMRSPEGQEFPNDGCFLEIVPEQKLVWTNALHPGYRPARLADDPHAFAFTAVITLAAHAGGTRYAARVIHGDADACARHRAMGFEAGWGKALDQLVAYMKTL